MELPEVASRLDGAIGLTLQSAEGGVAALRLEPGEVAVVEEEAGRSYLHGGVLASCLDTAAWYAAVSASEGDWLVVGLHLEALRLAAPEPHEVLARCVRAGRTRAVVDVEIRPEGDPGKPVSVGRVSLARAPSPSPREGE